MSYRIAAEITAITKKYGGDEVYHIAGLPVAEDSFGREMFNQMAYSAPMAGIIIFILMFLFFRNIRIIIPPMIVATVAIIWTMGFLVMTGNTVHIMSSMIPIFLFPIAVLDSIHMISEFHDHYGKGKHKINAIRRTTSELFKPMLFTSVTTVVGFLSLMTNDIPPVQVFGAFVAFGVAASWLLTITFNPAFAVLLPDRALRDFGASEDRGKILISILHKIRDITAKRYRIIIWGAAAIVIVSIFGLSMIVVNDNPVRWFKADHPMRQADRALNAHLDGTYMNYLIIDGGEEDAIKEPELMAYIEKLQRHLEQNSIVGSTASIADIVKKIKFELFGGIDRDNYSLPDNNTEIGQDLFLYEISGGDPDDLFKMITDDYAKANIWVQMTDGDNHAVSSVVDDADQFIKDNPPPGEIELHWAGLPYVNIIWQEKMVSGMRFSLMTSFAIVFLMMVFLFRSPILGAISMLPLSLTIIAIYAGIGFAGKPYDMPIAVLSSLTLGLSIDFAIHFIQRFRTIHKQTGRFRDTFNEIFEGPGRAIGRNVLVIALGFVPMFFSSLVPYITVGTFFFVIMAVSGAVTLLLLPALFIVIRRRLFPETADESNSNSDKTGGVS
jgi:predicted RND superfamily exporter protein